MKKSLYAVVVVLTILAMTTSVAFAASPKAMIGINVVLNQDISPDILADLGARGTVAEVVYEIRAVTMKIRAGDLNAIRALPYVATANPDAMRNGRPVDLVNAADFGDGINTWDLDAVNVTDFGMGRTETYDGAGVYVAVLDTGLLDSWRSYFPEERIAVEYAKSFGGGGGEVGAVSESPNKWEHDQNSHGTHVTSTILGYNLLGTAVNGVAPMVHIIPVKVLNQNGSAWSSVVAEGITYIGNLKAGPLADYPVVINMSLGGPSLDTMEKAAIDYAISQGVIVVASAGNEGTTGMGYPGAYAPVISVAASGWVGEWSVSRWWRYADVADPLDPEDYYITEFSSRALDGQDLDIAAPGSWIVGPYQNNSGNTATYYYLGGTSMASPHVAGIVALMAQKDPSLTATEAEAYLETAAVYLAPGCRTVNDGSANMVEYCWDADATGAGLISADAALGVMP